eukprot:997207_1
MPENGDCNYMIRAYNAEQNGAKAVVFGNDEKESGDVEEIPNENTDLITTIPTRMTTYKNGQLLSNALDNGKALEIEFACNEASNISLVLCFIDLSGDHWYLDGDYQLQVGLIKNSHPVWNKKGYLLVMDADYFLFLHDGSGKESMYWAITEDPEMIDNSKIVAKCSVGGRDNPMLCPSWFTTASGKEVSSKENTFTLNENIKINDSLCEITDNYICIQSSQSQLAGLYGTYRQFNALAPYWFREWVDCDTQPGYLTFINYGNSGVFWLIDPFDYWVIAECVISGYSPKEFDEYVAFHPELCTSWDTLVDGSLDAKYKIYDETMSVTVNECNDYECPKDISKPNGLCMTRNNVMHSFLEGKYELTGKRGRKWNTSEWIRVNKLYYQGEYVPVYLWYYGEIHANLNWWVIAMDNLTTATKNNGSSVYGYCASNTLTPNNCQGCWNFYFSGDDRAEGAWHSDCTFDMNPLEIHDPNSQCKIDDDISGIKVEWPEYLCVNDVLLMAENTTYNGDVDFNLLMGGYIMHTDGGGNGIPIWIKPPNDYINNETYIYYDKFYGYWQIGYDVSIDGAILLCMEDPDEYLPTQCDIWYDTESNRIGNLLLYSTGCDRHDILYKRKTEENDDTKIIIIVLIILGLIACFIAGFFYYKNQTKGGTSGFERTNGRHNSGDIELGDDVDQLNLKTNETIKGGFDMSPLNVDVDDDD